MSVRTFTRRFRKATGTTPGRWLLVQRVRASLALLETTNASIEAVATTVGFASAATYRPTSPRSCRRRRRPTRRAFSAAAA